MKAYPLLIAALLLLSACDFDIFPDPEPPPPPVLPPITQTGENTLGFLLDGEVWVPNRIFQAQYRKSDGAFNLPCNRTKFDTAGNNISEYFKIQYAGEVWEERSYELTTFPPGRGYFSSFEVGCKYTTEYPERMGLLTLTRLDTVERIISGTFYFQAVSEDCTDTISITDGRFDVTF